MKGLAARPGVEFTQPGSNPAFLLGAARPLPPSADIGREGSPLVKLRNSA